MVDGGAGPGGSSLYELFARACGLEAAARERLLAELERREPERAAALRGLLAADAREGALPASPEDVRLPRTAVGQALAGEAVDGAALLEELDRIASETRSGARYVLGEELGRGAMGRVLRAHDRPLRRDLAMKTILTESEDGAPVAGRIARFLTEARILGRLAHPAIVSVHELGVDAEGRAYFTMPIVRGDDLGAAFQKARDGTDGWSLPRAVGVLQHVCEAMAYAHSMGIVHRDLKPANVMVGEFGEVQVVDWGVAHVRGEPDARDLRPRLPDPGAETRGSALVRTMDGAVVGTPFFMPPEQARGEVASVDERADVYAVGAMLYELLCGRAPYERADGDNAPLRVLARVQGGAVEPLADAAPGAPPELVAIAERAMAREPAARYASMELLASDLRAFLEGRVVLAHRTGPVAELAAWVRRNRALAAALLSVFVLLVAGLGTALWFRGEAVSKERLATLRLADVLSLSAAKDLDDLVAEAEELWPPHPEMVPRYRAWLAAANELREGRAADPARGLDERPSLAEHRRQLEPLALGAAQGDFADPAHAWWHRQLAELVEGIERLHDGELGLASDCVAEPFGWGVQRRLAFASEIRARSVEAPEAAARWEEAIGAIARSPRYHGLRLEPQMGLLPLGEDRRSGLWEFAHLQTGAPAERGPDGRHVAGEETGLVLVLIPGGTFWMGAQPEDAEGRNHDPLSSGSELSPHEVELSPYFLSKYEMTQAQWVRLRGANPSGYSPERYPQWIGSQAHPVEQVSWHDCAETLARAGLVLPSEARWEYAARAGTSTPWWCGDRKESLRGKANLADRAARRAGVSWSSLDDELDDGAYLHAAVGSYPANGFGLHEVAGNVWEWCLDATWSYPAAERRDPVGGDPADANRARRGGSFGDAATYIRSSYRGFHHVDLRTNALGVRPAREVERR